MDTRNLPYHHSFYQPHPPDGKQAVASPPPAPANPQDREHQHHDAAPNPRYQAVKDELKAILMGVVRELISPKWWLYTLFEELGASKAFLMRFKGMSDVRIRTAILRSQLTRSKRFAILKRDGYRCHYCYKVGVPLEVDHVVPLYKGGTNDDSNLVAACHDCNHSKGIQDA